VNLPSFDRFFIDATGHRPFDYQRVLAGGDFGKACESHIINIPTGLGKTAAVALAWLWNRVELQRADWPRRLVYCLPMRTLVEQTAKNAGEWLKKHHSFETVGLHILMGGEETEDWDIHPERPAILIGTQDMLLSRALNRGYGMSRYRWPMHFGLLNNGCLWVLDETQLMGPGLATACQLEMFRRHEGRVSTAGVSSYPDGAPVTWYASATADPSHLKTRDWRGIDRPANFVVGIGETDERATTGTVAERRLATKSLEIRKDWNFGNKQKAPASERIDEIVDRHRRMTDAVAAAPAKVPRRTLVICNTVDRAVAVHEGISVKLAGDTEVDLMLMHSRFRPNERKQQADRLENPDIEKHRCGQIIVATQVVEAGVDLSSAILWTEIAPLACLVQRFGRLNRGGEFGFDRATPCGFQAQAIVVGIDAPDPASMALKNKGEKETAEKAAKKKYLPYDKAKCAAAWTTLDSLTGDASPAALEGVKDAVNDSIDRCPYSLQRHELLDFFDTDANLSLGFTDVSPFVRGIDNETDIYIAWREWPGSDKGDRPDFYADFQREELCPVSIGKVRDARALLSKGWIWRGKDSGWTSVEGLDVVPGMTILLPATAGGYNRDSGWTGREEDKPVASAYKPDDAPSNEDMLATLNNGWQSIAQHTNDVTVDWESIIGALGTSIFTQEEKATALTATHWHDLGKNHSSWQCAARRALTDALIRMPEEACPIAKFSLSESPRLKNDDGTPRFTGYALKKELRTLRQSFKPGLAHEVASALAFRQSEQDARGMGVQRSIESLLAEYLIMSHHGRVRKVLRDEIPRNPNDEKEAETVRGIANGDALPPVTIAGQELRCDSLSVDCRRMGRDGYGNESYTRGVLRLLDHYGPFRLAFFEALFRAADIRASVRAGKSNQRTQA
jgi:CRISPR-associated endonuclease/helicase Cas3